MRSAAVAAGVAGVGACCSPGVDIRLHVLVAAVVVSMVVSAAVAVALYM